MKFEPFAKLLISNKLFSKVKGINKTVSVSQTCKIMPNVKLFASLRKIAGKKEMSVTGSSARAVVSELVKQCPALAGYLLENEKIRQHVIFTINGHPTDDMDSVLAEEDQIAIFPPIAGG
jgi:MoaD family protein